MIYCMHRLDAEMGTSDGRSQFWRLLLCASSMQDLHDMTSQGTPATNASHAKPLRQTPQARLVLQHALSELYNLSSKQFMPNHTFVHACASV